MAVTVRCMTAPEPEAALLTDRPDHAETDDVRRLLSWAANPTSMPMFDGSPTRLVIEVTVSTTVEPEPS